ncbi:MULTISPECIES: AAA family ATPase [unclassified Pseudomonas]|uniref:AAA family ATPase n=1 Tax=unclassified Pseudomonas TaxID=196821 RepID=UPI000CD2F131|nr:MULTISPECIES: AAA family ATPase [unclassified Pseudomonas]POA29120.1 hypothetical protein C1887_20740 [Pseudomonas sp. GW456-R21]POA62985.1 hypothetical protein C1884_25900 [Pseudomonas sp. GW460-R15]
MLGLNLEEIKIYSETSEGVFSTVIPLKPGLNIIRAENTSGKSTCINAIAYALGLEAILGPSRKQPFPKSMYSYLLKNKGSEHHNKVLFSGVELSLSNRSGVKACLKREALGNPNKITVIVEGETTRDYFLGAAGDIGSAKSTFGFHFWLERFIGWTLPKVVTYEGRETPLYLECIFPLFFIEQKRGWSEIQANTPSYYKIKNVKSSATEFVLGLEDYAERNKIAQLRKSIDELQSEWDKNITASFSIAELNSIQLKAHLQLDNELGANPISFIFPSGNITLTLDQRLRSLQNRLNEITSNSKKRIIHEPLLEKSKALFQTNKTIESLELKFESLLSSEFKSQQKLDLIENDLDRYKQLKRLQDVGSKADLPVVTKNCPICESEMYESLVKPNASIKPLSVEQNVEYLKNQKDFYQKIILNQSATAKNLQLEINARNEQKNLLHAEITTLRKDEENLNKDEISLLRERIETEQSIRETKKIQIQELKLNTRALAIHKDWSLSKGALEQAKKRATTSISSNILTTLEETLKSNLMKFGYNSSDINAIKVSRLTYRPELDGFDIVADSSASDYIRIIWSYTLALLELSSVYEQVKHSGFVVFDEPRQHEANKKDFGSLIKKATHTENFGGQVIIATSIDLNEILTAEDYDNINIINFDDYILQPSNG